MSDVATPPPADPTPSTPGIPAGWYFDQTSGRQRWWDGNAWTENFAPMAAPASAPPSGWSIAALIVAIIAFLTGWVIGLGFILGLLALTVGTDGIRNNHPGRGLAVAAVIISAFPVIIGLFLGVGWILSNR